MWVLFHNSYLRWKSEFRLQIKTFALKDRRSEEKVEVQWIKPMYGSSYWVGGFDRRGWVRGGGRGGAANGGGGGVLPICVQRRGAAAMLTKKPGSSILPTGEHSLLYPLARCLSPPVWRGVIADSLALFDPKRSDSETEKKQWEKGWRLNDRGTGSSFLFLLIKLDIIL